MKKQTVKAVIPVVTLVLALMSASAWAGNKKLMTVNAAKVLAERAVIESVVGLKLRATDKVENLVATHMKIEAKTAAEVKGIKYTDIVYDPAKDIAKVTAELEVDRVRNIVGGDIRFGNQVIRRVAFASSSPDMVGPLKALRAAELDAYKQLAKQIVGFKLASNTTVENYILKNDNVRAKVLAAIWGAELASYRWDNEGDAYVTLRLKTGIVEDVMGQRVDYKGEVIEVEGMGAQHDDFANSPDNSGGGLTRVNSTIREGSLDIPVSSSTSSGSETVPGGGTQLRD
ncbi:MAG: hypothetical protein Kow0089_06120 [Desulfobulbaceae bacterium]